MAEQEAANPYRVGAEPIEQLIVTTGNEVAGHDIVKYLAIVRGIVVRATSIGQGLLGSLKALGGGNIAEFTEVCEAARHDAYQQMIQHAQEVGADAIIGMLSSSISLPARVKIASQSRFRDVSVRPPVPIAFSTPCPSSTRTSSK